MSVTGCKETPGPLPDTDAQGTSRASFTAALPKWQAPTRHVGLLRAQVGSERFNYNLNLKTDTGFISLNMFEITWVWEPAEFDAI